MSSGSTFTAAYSNRTTSNSAHQGASGVALVKLADALATRAVVHLRLKSTEAAKSDAEAALKIDAIEDAFSVLGDVYLGMGNYDKAIENFAQARRIDESVAEAYYARSKILKENGQVEKARDSLNQALVLDPDIESRLR